MGRRRNTKKEVVGAADASATTVPLASGTPTGGGGSVMAGNLLTEGSFIQPPRLAFVDSVFGQRYLVNKTIPMSKYEVAVRGRAYTFDVRGFEDYGTFTNTDLPGTTDAETLLLDWYPLVRDMGKRSLKYKHLPLSLATQPALLRYWLNTYFYVVANTAILLNLNRLGMYSKALANVTALLPQYMSRLSRLWRRTSALPAPNFLRSHALRAGMIPCVPGLMAPYIRYWRGDKLLASGSGGPSLTEPTDQILTNLVTTARIAEWVAAVETAERWLEIGTATIETDFTALKDIIDMTRDVVPGAFETGLPPADSLPGLMMDKSLLNDILARAFISKEDLAAATDQWVMFPAPGDTPFSGRIPVFGWGQPGLYEFCSLGAPKFGIFNNGFGNKSADVNTPVRIIGTDFKRSTSCATGPFGAEYEFGQSTGGTYDEQQINHDAPTTITSKFTAIDWDTASSIRTQMFEDTAHSKHIWWRAMAARRASWTGATWMSFIEESPVDYTIWADPQDMQENYAQYLAIQLGVPYR